MIKKLLRKAGLKKSRSNKTEDILYNIEGFELILPHDHKLPDYQKAFKNYDRNLKLIVQKIADNKFIYDNVILDIGANVGDTVAQIRNYTNATILCIEGDELYLSYLKKNTVQFSNVFIIGCYISTDQTELKGFIDRKDGTARIVKANSNSDEITLIAKTLNEIITENCIDVSKIQLIKIDTDGFDFSILLSNKELIDKMKPNLFFEFDIHFNDDDLEKAQLLISVLEKNNYGCVIYDNFGNLLNVIEKDILNSFRILSNYLKLCAEKGGGIYYFDIFASTDRPLLKSIVAAVLK